MRLPSSPRPRRPPSAPDRLVLRRVVLDDLPFYTRLHALPKVAEHLYPEGPAALARRDESMDGVHAREL